MKPHHASMAIVAVLSVVGLTLRIISCFHGFPAHLHVDEPTVVASAMDMLQRHSWEANVYNRPDQLEIKIDAALFTVFSWVLYHAPAYEMFATKETIFYLIARGFTAICGTLCIPLSALVAKHALVGLGRREQGIASVFAAAFAAFPSILVQQASYATPDVVSALCMLAIAYFMIRCLENSKHAITLCSIALGAGITIKYPLLVLAVPIAAMTIFKAITEKRGARWLLITACKIALITIATVFVIAPNLFTNFSEVLKTVAFESRSTHLGADGLGFFGNLLFYAGICVNNFSWVSVVFVAIYITWAIRSQSAIALVPTIGLLYWAFISILALHWNRWGVPCFALYSVLTGAGVGCALAYAAKSSQSTTLGNNKLPTQHQLAMRFGVCVIASTMALSMLASGICVTKSSILPTTLLQAERWCHENNVTPDNSTSDGYSPLDFLGGDRIFNHFSLDEDGNLQLDETARKSDFLIINDNHKNRYFAEPERYHEQIELYNTIDFTFETIYKLEGQDDYVSDTPSITMSLIKGIAFLASATGPTGDSITIYRLNEQSLSITNTQQAQ